MEPLTSAIGSIAVIRPTPATSGDLANVLRDGRVVAGEVLETFDGGSVVLGIAGRRVPAESHLELEVGQRFLATTEIVDGEIVLRISRGAPNVDDGLLSALRAVVGQDFGAGEILENLRSTSADAPAFARLIAALSGHVFEPAADGEALRELLLQSGLRYEGALRAAQTGDRASVGLRTAALREVAARWVESWRSALPIAATEIDASTLRTTIASLLSEALQQFADGADPKAARWSAVELEGWLKRAIAARPSAGSTAAVRAVIAHAGAQVDAAPSDPGAAALLRWLFGGPLDESARSLLNDIARRTLGGDLKGQLLATLADLDDGPAHEAVRHALESLETEQLMNVARRRFDQAWHFSLPVPDVERWTTAQFLHTSGRPSDGTDEDADGDARDSAQRLVMGIDFSRLGPIRADLCVTAGSVVVRLSVGRADIAVALRERAARWSEDLAIGGRTAQIAVSERPGLDVALHAVAPDVRFLTEHHLMDVSG